MKNKIINYYILIITIIFAIYNLLFENLIINGFLYHIIMIVLIIINILLLIKYKEKIRYKNLAFIIYCLIWIISRDFYGIIFTLLFLMTLISIDFTKNSFIKIIKIFITLFISSFSIPFLYLHIIIFALGDWGEFTIYEDTHYYCENNVEIYSYSFSAIDEFHYNIGKHYEFLDINDIIYISYKEKNEVSEEDYDNYLNTHKCKLVGDTNGSK